MILVLTSNQQEVGPEFRMKPFRGVADHRKSAAVVRTVLGKSRHEDMAAGPYRAPNLRDVRPTIGRISEKVKNRAIVPDRVSAVVELCAEDISAQPLYLG